MRGLLAKAEENIQAADLLIQANYFEIAVSRAYYAMFYTAEALLILKGLSFSSHGQVQSAFGQHFAKTGELDSKFHRYLLDSFRKRQVADYQTSSDISGEFAVAVVNRAEEFLNAARIYFDENPPVV